MTADGGLTIVGGGNMGAAFLDTVLAGGADGPLVSRDEVTVVEPDPARAAVLRDSFGVEVCDVADAVANARTVVLVVKPYLVEGVLGRTAGVLTDEHLLVSLVGGADTARIERAAPTDQPVVVRCCPNLAIAVRQGLTAISPGAHADAAHLDFVEALFEPGGRVVQVPERLLDVVSVLSGSVPGYFCYMVEALTDAGVLLGLTHELSATMAKQAMLGAATLLQQPGADAVRLRVAVSSPGGVTIAGIRALEERGVRAALMAAAEAGRDRAAELGATPSAPEPPRGKGDHRDP